jgi:hypothetical protein
MAQISDYLTGIIMFTFAIMCGVGLIMVVFADRPDITNSVEFTEFNTTFNTYGQLQSSIGELNKSIQLNSSDSKSFADLGVIGSLLNSGFTTFVFTYRSFGFMNAVFGSAMSYFGLSELNWVVAIIVALVTLLFVFGIYTAIFAQRV